MVLLLQGWLISHVVQRFQELFAQTKYKEAAELAAESPQGLLRTPETVAKFQENNAWLGLKMLISQGLKQLVIASVAINLVQFSYRKKSCATEYASPSRS